MIQGNRQGKKKKTRKNEALEIIEIRARLFFSILVDSLFLLLWRLMTWGVNQISSWLVFHDLLELIHKQKIKKRIAVSLNE